MPITRSSEERSTSWGVSVRFSSRYMTSYLKISKWKSKRWSALWRLQTMPMQIVSRRQMSSLNSLSKLRKKSYNLISKSNWLIRRLKKKNRWRTSWKPKKLSKMNLRSCTARPKLKRRSIWKSKARRHSGASVRTRWRAWYLRRSWRNTKRRSIGSLKQRVPKILTNSSITSLRQRNEISRSANTSMSSLKKMSN